MVFYRGIFDIVTFEPIDSSPYIQKVFDLKQSDKYEPYNERF